MKMSDPGHWYSVCITLTLKVTTPVKLDIVLPDERSMLAEFNKDNDDVEVHYMTVECETDRHYIRLNSLKNMFKTLFGRTRSQEEIDANPPFVNWVVTDFDNCLNGNPHTVFEQL